MIVWILLNKYRKKYYKKHFNRFIHIPDLAEDKANNSLQLAKTTLGQVDRMSVDILPNKDDVMANLHSCIGNAYLELGKNELALKHHQKDLEYSNNW